MRTLKLFGPPGTGKTHEQLDLFERELKTTRPERVAFLTFTRAARAVVLERSGRPEAALPYLRTIHSLCYRQLGVTPAQVLKPKDLRYFGRQLGIELSGRVPNPWEGDATRPVQSPADVLLQLNHVGRHRGVNLNTMLREAPPEIDFHFAKWFTLAYREWKSSEHLLDYTDLLTDYLAHGQPLDIDALFVDEAQDLSALQWQVVRKLGARAARRYLAGDDDQAIFGWAGASARAFIDEPADEVRVLRQSHRVPRAVWRQAQAIVRRIGGRVAKDYAPRDAEGEVGCVGALEAADLSEPTLVLYRNHFRGAELARRLMEAGIAFAGGPSPLGKDEVRHALAGWRALVSGGTASAASLAAFGDPRYLVAGARSARQLFTVEPREDNLGVLLSRLPAVDYVERALRRDGWDRVLAPTTRLLSIHQAKGDQAHTVVLDTELARRTYEGDLDDEHRVWYVAVTRARDRLLSLATAEPMTYTL